eukprot:CAMPEP_0201509966 /NCGR_PEP_ID=MMETSP0161_2-20130828/2856_1 /ASSEMBLY_ACC=CAM_ASM_000251 /TAXON_ID=180227 /ORGANISM="Neoparamoeba aestuarina, Strain SoJaBio B1-5/56/2" /LENGTH=505 /DNA_ID=CAMNT_0047905077 /DNA_START=187 /DNA_END=1705 /DNA_ORIENTATION=+
MGGRWTEEDFPSLSNSTPTRRGRNERRIEWREETKKEKERRKKGGKEGKEKKEKGKERARVEKEKGEEREEKKRRRKRKGKRRRGPRSEEAKERRREKRREERKEKRKEKRRERREKREKKREKEKEKKRRGREKWRRKWGEGREEEREWQRKEREKKRRREEGEKKGWGREKRAGTWNLRGGSLGGGIWGKVGRRKVERVGIRAEERGWELVVMSDIGAGEESEGGWGEISGEMVVFGRKVAIMLRGECLKMWREGGRKWGRGERWVWVEVGGERWIGVYAPHSGKKKKIRKEFWEEIEEVIEGAGEKMIWVGGDLNAQVGRGEREEGKWVRGKWGMEETSRSGKELVEWCWKIGMGVVTTFVCQSGSGRKEKIGRRRGTWWDVMRKEGKEIDGWLVNRVNIRLVKGCKTWGVGLGGGEETDHWPKEVRKGGEREKEEDGGEEKREEEREEEKKESEREEEEREEKKESSALRTKKEREEKRRKGKREEREKEEKYKKEEEKGE